MDSLSNKVNNDTIKFVNKTYKGLSIINSERFYLPTKNHYDDKIENCIYQMHDILDEIYQLSIHKITSYDMELYDSDSDIPDIQETFEECITPRTSRVVNEPSTPSAPVKPGKKIIVEEESEEDLEECEDVVEKEVEHSDVLSHIMGNYDSEESDDSDGSYDKLSSDEDSENLCDKLELKNCQSSEERVDKLMKYYNGNRHACHVAYDKNYNVYVTTDSSLIVVDEWGVPHPRYAVPGRSVLLVN